MLLLSLGNFLGKQETWVAWTVSLIKTKSSLSLKELLDPSLPLSLYPRQT